MCFLECSNTIKIGECINSGMDYWTGILEWTIGLAYFWFLHIFVWLA